LPLFKASLAALIKRSVSRFIIIVSTVIHRHVENKSSNKFAVLKIMKIYLHHIYRTKIKHAMNKTIGKENLDRVKRCVFDMNNKQNFYETTGIHFTTVKRILDRGWAREEQIDTIIDYCDKVEGLTTANAAD